MESKHGSSIRGWLCRIFGKPKSVPVSYSGCNQTQEHDPILTSLTSSTSSCVSDCTSCSTSCSSNSHHHHSSSSQPHSSSSALSPPSRKFPPALSAPFRWTLQYDVYICHSDKNFSQAYALVSFLESPSRGLRCFLQHRNCPPGGAIPTELCEAVRCSHCWVLLVSPDFLRDNWCLYQMNQVIMEGLMSQRIIPAVVEMAVSEVPQELRFLFTVDLSRNTEAGYGQIYRTVLQYLKDTAEKHSSESGSCGAAGGHVEADGRVH